MFDQSISNVVVVNFADDEKGAQNSEPQLLPRVDIPANLAPRRNHPSSSEPVSRVPTILSVNEDPPSLFDQQNQPSQDPSRENSILGSSGNDPSSSAPVSRLPTMRSVNSAPSSNLDDEKVALK